MGWSRWKKTYVCFFRRLEAETSDVVIIGTISTSHQPAYALLDLRSTFSYVFAYYAMRLYCYEPMFVPMRVATPVGDSLVVA